MNRLGGLYTEADQNGLQIYHFPMRSITAISTPDGTVAMDVDKLQDRREEARVLAHEMGHCATGYFYTVNTPLCIRGRCEERAERWAIKRLVPLAELTQVLDAGLTEAHELADYFEVPEDFIVQCVRYYRDAQGSMPQPAAYADQPA